MRILLATTNPGKIDRYRQLIQQINVEIEVLVPADVGLADLEIDEQGKNEEENAINKARGFYNALPADNKITCFAGDSGTYLEGVLPEEQPGVFTRRITQATSNITADGNETIQSFYQDLSHKYGGVLPGYYLDYHCLYNGKPHTIADKRPFILTDEVHGKIVSGFPMMNLWKSVYTGKYGSEMNLEESFVEMAPIREAIIQLLAMI